MPRKQYPSDLADQFVVRFPDGWREAIKATAAKNRRSMNSEILAVLEGALGLATTERVSQANSSAVASSHSDALQGVGQFHP